MADAVNNKYRRLRSQLISKGTNLRRWAQENNFPITTVYGAARGQRAGIEAIKIKKLLEAYANS